MEHRQPKLVRHSVVMTSAPHPVASQARPTLWHLWHRDVLRAATHWHLRRQADLRVAAPSYLRHENGGDGDGVDSSCA
jgi:hypothetical protein